MSARLLESDHLGLDRVIGAWERAGVLVDPGPASTIETVLAPLGGEEPRAILLTHVHLDHAGATGWLVRRYPDVPVFVHERGAPHLADPARLLESARRLYGEDMNRLWGEVLPVPEANLTALVGGERVEGMEVLATPGHASHHVAYLDEATGDAYVGDVAGVRIPPSERVWMPTPPPDIDVEAWTQSIELLASREPATLRLTHFGAADEPAAHLGAAREELATLAERARPRHRDSFLAGLGERIDGEEVEVGKRVRAAMPPEQVWQGLERYWRKAERDCPTAEPATTASSLSDSG